MSLTLAQIRSQVRFLTKEPNSNFPTFATDVQVDLWANQSQLEIQSKTKDVSASNLPNSTSNSADSTTGGVRLYSLPTNIMDIYMVEVNGIKLSYIKFADLWTRGGMTWNKFQSFPTFYYFESDPTTGVNKIGFWPTPSGAWPIIYYGVKKPTPMTVTTDTPDLDDRLHFAVVYKVCKAMAEARRENDRAAYWDAMATKDINDYMSSGRQTTESTQFLDGACPTD